MFDICSLHMSVVTLICVVSVISGVYCQVISKTKVHIKVYVPSGFIQNGSEVYFSQDNKGSLSTKGMKFRLDVSQFGKYMSRYELEV